VHRGKRTQGPLDRSMNLCAGASKKMKSARQGGIGESDGGETAGGERAGFVQLGEASRAMQEEAALRRGSSEAWPGKSCW
jgi:hypothetical protein